MSASKSPAPLDTVGQMVVDKITFGLSVYPFINSSMLHILIGPAMPIEIWKPILANLLAEGIVVESQVVLSTPRGRTQTYTIYHLAYNQYNRDDWVNHFNEIEVGPDSDSVSVLDTEDESEQEPQSEDESEAEKVASLPDGGAL